MSTSQNIESLRKTPVITAIVTPYNNDGSIDYDTMEKLLEKQVAAGIKAVVIAGTTGEGHLLSWNEQYALLEFSIKNFTDKLAIIGNMGSNCTREAIKATEKSFESGMTASLQVNPYYGMTNSQGMLAHFNEVLKLGPGIIYNVPSRTAQEIPVEVLKELSLNSNFIGVKECQGAERLAELSRQGIFCWSGNDGDFFEGYVSGHCAGVISVASNIIPKQFLDYFQEGEYQQLESKHSRLINWLSRQPNPIGVKTLLAMIGAIKPVFRLPYTPLSLEDRKDFLAISTDLWTQQECDVLKDEHFVVLP